MRRLGLAALVPVLAVVAYLLAGLAGALVPGGDAVRPGGPGAVTVGLLPGPIHYDFLFPATPEVRARFAFARGAGVPVDHPGAEWLVVGWGAEAFYTTVGTWADLNARAVGRAILGDRAVLRVAMAGPVPPGAAQWIALEDAQFAALLGDVAGKVAPGAAPLLSQDNAAFFPAKGPFHLLRTCNVRVGERLRAVGIPFGRWTPTPQAVRLSLWRFGAG